MRQDGKAVVDTKSGKIKGSYQKGSYIFKGIPYAAPPIGELRWLPPQPVKPWIGVRPAQTFGRVAPQGKREYIFMKEFQVEEPQSEDCLYLNIWSPGSDDSRRPVLFWIHGGRFNMGSGSNPAYDGSTLAKRGDVVVVTINYRLGTFGFLNLKEVTGGKIPATGNEGLFDQIAALKWVRDNIVNFGGDPDNVTIFGESAGSMCVACLLAMPQARGLFHKAILQSGANSARPLDQAVQVTQQFLRILGLNARDIDAIRALTVEQLLFAQQELGVWMLGTQIRGVPVEATVDGETLLEMPLDAAKHGSTAKVPVIAGSNLDEWRLMETGYKRLTNLDETGLLRHWQRFLPPDRAQYMIDTYRNVRAKRGASITSAEIFMAIQGDLQFRMPAIRLVEAQREHNLPAYNYLFTWKSPEPDLGACHALEIGFVFGNLSPSFCGSGPAAEKLSMSVQDAWIAFARTGNPSCKSVGSWPQYGARRDTMLLGKDCHVEEAPYEEERRAWDLIPNSFLG